MHTLIARLRTNVPLSALPPDQDEYLLADNLPEALMEGGRGARPDPEYRGDHCAIAGEPSTQSRRFPIDRPEEAGEYALVLVGSDKVWSLRHPRYGSSRVWIVHLTIPLGFDMGRVDDNPEGRRVDLWVLNLDRHISVD